MYTDHKSLESWYKEDLCTISGSLGRRGRWHEFSSRYHIEVVHKPSKDKTVTDALSWWAYQARLADDTNSHDDDADPKGVMKQERELKEKEANFWPSGLETRKSSQIQDISMPSLPWGLS